MTEENQEIPEVIQPELNAVLTCPDCETKQDVLMPETKFQHYYKCINEECMADITPLTGKCCVFCSYSDKLCPQKQVNPNADEKTLHSLI